MLHRTPSVRSIMVVGRAEKDRIAHLRGNLAPTLL